MPIDSEVLDRPPKPEKDNPLELLLLKGCFWIILAYCSVVVISTAGLLIPLVVYFYLFYRHRKELLETDRKQVVSIGAKWLAYPTFPALAVILLAISGRFFNPGLLGSFIISFVVSIVLYIVGAIFGFLFYQLFNKR